jgi:hypothetical protein
MTGLDVLIAWLLILALCGGLFGIACVIERGSKYWSWFWKNFRWRRMNDGWMARYK